MLESCIFIKILLKVRRLFSFLFVLLCFFSNAQEKIFADEYLNSRSMRNCFYTKSNLKPFNGYLKINESEDGSFHIMKIENGCDVTIVEEFNSNKELVYRSKYVYNRNNNQIVSYQNDSINLGKSELLDKKIKDSASLVSKRIYNFYHLSTEKESTIVTPVNGIIYRNENEEIYSIQYKNGIAIKLVTYYDNKEFEASNPNIPKLKMKESHELLFNENGNIFDEFLIDKNYPFIFTGEYIKWDLKGNVIHRRKLNIQN